MNSTIFNRIINEANYMIESQKTIREIAKKFRISKSTVHKDLHERLKKIDISKAKEVDDILKYHINIRHIKGGEATRRRYIKIK